MRSRTCFRSSSVAIGWTLLLSCGESDRPDAPTMETWTLNGPTLRIGSLDEGPEALTTVGALVVNESGGVFVLLPQDHEVRVFDRDGSFLRTIGREGEGPGELSQPVGLALLEDTLWVMDQGLQRLSAFDESGTHLMDRPVPPLEPSTEGVGTGPPHPLAHGRVAHGTGAIPFTSLWGVDHPFPLLVRTLGLDAVDTIAILRNPHPSQFIQTTERAGEVVSISIRRQPFSDETLMDVSPDGREIALVDRLVPAPGDLAHYTVTRISVDGDTLFTVDVPYPPMAIPSSVTDSILDEASGGAGGSATSDLRDLFYFPPSYPPVSGVLGGADGTTWVARERRDGPPLTWEVFGRRGEPLGRVETPQGLTLYHADGDAIWGVVTDELDIPYVVRYSLARPAS